MAKAQETGRPGETRVDSSRKLMARLVKSIAEGEYPAGSTLPKIHWLARRHRVSDHTVRRAYTLLVEGRYAHRDGRRYVSGAGIPAASQPGALPLSIRILQWNPYAWESVRKSERTGKFCERFLHEAETHSVYLDFISGEPTAEGRRRDARPRKSPELHPRIRERFRCAGTIILGRPGPDFPVLDLVKEQIRLGKPVVWFDSGGEGLEGLPRHRLFTRCHFDEKAALRIALQFLADRGHSRLGYLATNSSEWQQRRRGLLEELVREFPGFTLLSEKFLYEYLESPEAGDRPAALEYLRRHGPPRAQEAFASLQAMVRPLMEKYDLGASPAEGKWEVYDCLCAFHRWRQRTRRELEMPERAWDRILLSWLPILAFVRNGVTALLSPNDLAASTSIMPWILDAGLGIPEDLSVISFDCWNLPMPLPLTSVDFGFGFLGYQAFHTILGEHSTVRTPQGNIAARARVVDRGSVGWAP